MNRNLVGSILGKSFIKIVNLVPIRWQAWPPKAILVSDWLISKKSSLKPLCQMNRNLVGSTYGRFCIKFPQSRMKGEPLVLVKSTSDIGIRRFLQTMYLYLFKQGNKNIQDGRHEKKNIARPNNYLISWHFYFSLMIMPF